LDIPCFREQYIHKLRDIPSFIHPEMNYGCLYDKQLLPLTPCLYSNHNCIGFSPAINFSSNQSHYKIGFYKKELQLFFETLGIDSSVVLQLFDIGKGTLKTDRGILLQIFDSSESLYSFIDKHCYPSYPNGFPSENNVISKLYTEQNYPTELRLVLTNQYTLNPNTPLRIIRYDKMQPSIVKTYEKTLKEIITSCQYDDKKVEEYRNKIHLAWHSLSTKNKEL